VLISERTARGGAPVSGAAGPQWRLTRVGHIRCSRPLFSMRFSPRALGRCGEPILLNMGGWRATMVAGVGGEAWLKLGIDDGGLRGSSG
jgi:hypothetical protein